MKKYSIILSAVFLSLLFFNFTSHNKEDNFIIPEEGGLNMPDDVKAIIDNSCYGCHNTDSKNIDGKEELNFDYFGNEYSNIKSAGKLKEVAKLTMDGDMPPSKFLEHYPEKEVDNAQKKLIYNWAMGEAKKYKEK